MRVYEPTISKLYQGRCQCVKDTLSTWNSICAKLDSALTSFGKHIALHISRFTVKNTSHEMSEARFGELLEAFQKRRSNGHHLLLS